jgi:alkylation response protein AidB-like acyl-CoA dehydrogenase
MDLDLLLRPNAPRPHGSVREWWGWFGPEVDRRAPLEAAVVGGAAADRLGFAFAAGYQAALRALAPGLPRGEIAALCATEARGAHPRDLQTALKGGRLEGEKHFVTLAPEATALLVVASTGLGASGRNQLAVARVKAGAPGVELQPMPELPFTPEIPHAVARFRQAPVEEVLEGDGYERYLKPFRTIEDLHVHASSIAYVSAVAARSGWPAPVRERLAALIAATGSVARMDLTAPATHVTLGGVLALAREVIDGAEALWDRAPADERERWKRDRPLLEVASRARAARLEAAWKRLSP